MPGYNFSVVIKDGVGQVLNVTPGMEDGVWEVGGTDDQWGASINVTHKRPSGQYVAEAQHASNPKNYEAPEIPGLEALKSAYLSMGFSPAVAEKSAMEALSKLPGGMPTPEPSPVVPSGLKMPGGISKETDLTRRGPVRRDEVGPDTSIPDGAKPFDFNDKSTWPETLRKQSDGNEDDATSHLFTEEPRMRGDIHD